MPPPIITIYEYKANVWTQNTTAHLNSITIFKHVWYQKPNNVNEEGYDNGRYKNSYYSGHEILNPGKILDILDKNDWIKKMEETHKKINARIHAACKIQADEDKIILDAEYKYQQSKRLSKMKCNQEN